MGNRSTFLREHHRALLSIALAVASGCVFWALIPDRIKRGTTEASSSSTPIGLPAVNQQTKAVDDNTKTARLAALALIPPNSAPSASPVVPSVSIASNGVQDSISRLDVPPLEQERQSLEKNANAGQVPPSVETSFACSTPVQWRNLSPSHIEVTVTEPNHRNFVMFKLTGLAHRLVRVDIKMDDGGDPLHKWAAANPVYAEVNSLDEERAYQSAAATTFNKQPARSWTGSGLPSTDGQSWHFIANTWRNGSYVLSFVQRFESDSAYLALRVPYPPEFNESHLRELAAKSSAKVIEVGRSEAGHPLLLIELGMPGAGTKSKPCALIYGGEHADEYDAMWAADGAIEYLLGGGPDAARLLSTFTFLVIPVFDPDASMAGRHENVMCTFMSDRKSRESIAYANWFQKWVNDGNRLDVVFDLHNIQAGEGKNIACALLEGVGTRGSLSASMQKLIAQNALATGLSVETRPWMHGWSPDRLSGWLARRYGPITFSYELNSQAISSHLNLSSTKELGQVFLKSFDDFLTSTNGTKLLAEVDARRQERLARWAAHSSLPAGIDAIEAEGIVSKGVGIRPDGKAAGTLLVERWYP